MNANTFHKAMQNFGGRLDSARLTQSGAQLLESYREHIGTLIARFRSDNPRLPQIHFDYVDNPSLNAYAFEHGDQYFIGVTWGTFVILRLLFMRMLADRNTLPGIGDPSHEKEGLPALDDLCIDMSYVRLTSGSLVVGAPQDEARLTFAVSAFESALSFLIRHELTHILHGHLVHRILAAHGSLLLELGWNSPSEAATWIRQVMEFDADRYAAYTLAEYFLSHTFDRQGNPLIGAEDARIAMNPYFVGVCSLFRLFGDEAVAGRSLGTLSYPPVRYRQYMAMAFFCDRIKDAGFRDLADTAGRILDDSYTAVEHAFPAFTKVMFCVDGIREVVSPAGRAYMLQLHDAWKNQLRGELLPLSYTDKLQ